MQYVNLFLSVVRITLPVNVVMTVGHSVARDPLITRAALAALGLNVCHPKWVIKFHLKPLVDVVWPGRPSSSLAIHRLEIETGVCWAMIWVPLRGGRNLGVGDRSAFHSQRLDDAFWRRKVVEAALGSKVDSPCETSRETWHLFEHSYLLTLRCDDWKVKQVQENNPTQHCGAKL